MASVPNNNNNNPSESSSSSSAPPSPKSPPPYPDLYGKRRQLAKVQFLEREICILEEELKTLESMQLASKCCKELNDFLEGKMDPLLAINHKASGSSHFWKCLRVKFGCKWICCFSGGCCCYPRVPSSKCCSSKKACKCLPNSWLCGGGGGCCCRGGLQIRAKISKLIKCCWSKKSRGLCCCCYNCSCCCLC
ncbi:guanine nucleotide-binding protein subunit gamma 3-like [Impatiens glandulifera]|uniref:guanine nucleotide-binding protein subunit gamma 3-like n=1 Tax=Impatiens glandulifera TaxID=253017 RepID=UPI001FB15305|nr:guanine nucleotide-binding protein subunit gamma 3-like [Impatiens glandulifera]XP_047318836.1 guanine nucleotide-binding protein subunit gamma 3-like [Impatiens glandulifera]